jgi:quinol monooxygenase YgiN
MVSYRAIVHYHLKNGMQNQALKFLENELIKHAQEFGCHNLEILQNETHPESIVGIATWNSLEDARRFQAEWQNKEEQLMRFCSAPPKREFCKVYTSYFEKTRKAA